MISVVAVLIFNISLVVSGVLEVVARHQAFLWLKKYFSVPKIGIETDKKVTTVLWIVPAVDLLFHLGCDWAAWRVRAASSLRSASIF